MDNFFNYVTKTIDDKEVEIWLNVNNIIPEKMELFYDFCRSLHNLILDTYLGENPKEGNETKIYMNEEDKKKHFDWCWNRTIENFNKENIKFNSEGEHYDYISSFFLEVYYNQKEDKVRYSIGSFFDELFSLKKPFTKSDLDMLSGIYKSMEKNII